MSVPKTSAICVATASGMPASSVAANSDERTVPLASKRPGGERRQHDRGDELVADALDAQAREHRRHLVAARRGVAGDQVLELAGRIGPHLDALAGAAFEQLARDGVGAQECRSSGVGDVEAGQQRVGGVAGAGQVAAEQVDVLAGERVELRLHVVGGDFLRDSFAWAVSTHRAPAGRHRTPWRRNRPGRATRRPPVSSGSARPGSQRAPRHKPRRLQWQTSISMFCGALGLESFGADLEEARASVDRRRRGATRIVGSRPAS